MFCVFLVFVFLFCVVFVSVLFALLLVFWLDVVVFFCVFCFFGGFKGQVRWPKGPPHLGPKPLLIVLCLFFICFLCFLFFFCFLFWCFVVFCFLFFLEGLKGQVRWPKGPPHLALNPPYFLFLFPYLCVCKKTLFPPLQKRAFLCIFLCLPLFLFSLF